MDAVASEPSDELVRDAEVGPCEPRWIVRAVWALVALGVAARVLRFALRFPLWGDEAFVAANFIDRGYADLLQPMDYHQVCPLGFLGLELSAVRLLGFNEFGLRIVPLAAGIAALLAFVRVSHLALRGWAWAWAVGVLAVGYYPVRHAAEAKPYSLDLLVAVLLLWPALRAWRAPREARWWWLLAAAAPAALLLSHPAVFVAGGLSLALAWPVWSRGSRGALAAFAVYNATLLASFLALYAAFTGQQYSTEIGAGGMGEIWKDAFPPWREPLRLAGWLVDTHTGHMLAYPAGGKRGGSTATALACAAALVWMARRRQWSLMALITAPFGLALVAAALQRYPYGGSQRTMQYTAPLICLLAGLGAAWCLTLVRSAPRRKALIAAALVGLALVGLGGMARDVRRPYKTPYDEASRRFVQTLVAETPPDARLACVHRDLRRDLAPGCFEWEHSARYQCNLAIYGAGRAEAPGPRLRCVVYSVPHFPVAPECRDRWLAEMDARYARAGQRRVELHADSPTHQEWYEIYDFAPQPQRLEADGRAASPSEQARRAAVPRG